MPIEALLFKSSDSLFHDLRSGYEGKYSNIQNINFIVKISLKNSKFFKGVVNGLFLKVSLTDYLKVSLTDFLKVSLTDYF